MLTESKFVIFQQSVYNLLTPAQDKFTTSADHGLDMQNRAYYMTITIQRWLSLRLDLFGNLLVLGICLFAAGFRETVNPAKIGVVLTYTLGSEFIFRPKQRVNTNLDFNSQSLSYFVSPIT